MSHCQFKYPLTHYPKVYGVSYRTILRWAEKGFPLDDEQATRLLTAGTPQTAKPGSGPHQRTRTTATPRNAPAGSLGLSASIQRLQQAEANAHGAYLHALANETPLIAAHARKAWQELVEALRKTELSSPEVQEANKTSVSLSEIQTVLNELFTKLRQDLDTLPRRIALELVGADEISIRQVLAREAEEIVSRLFACKYLTDAE